MNNNQSNKPSAIQALGLGLLAAGIAAAVVFGAGIPALAAIGAAAQWAAVGAFFVGAPSLLKFYRLSAIDPPPGKNATTKDWLGYYAKLLLFGTLALPMTVMITLGIAKAAGASIAGSAVYVALSKAVAPVSGVIAQFFAGFGILASIQAAGITIAVGMRRVARHMVAKRQPNGMHSMTKCNPENNTAQAKPLVRALETAAKALLLVLPWSLALMVCSAATAGALMVCSAATAGAKLFVAGAKTTWQTAAAFIATTDTAIATGADTVKMIQPGMQKAAEMATKKAKAPWGARVKVAANSEITPQSLATHQ